MIIHVKQVKLNLGMILIIDLDVIFTRLALIFISSIRFYFTKDRKIFLDA